MKLLPIALGVAFGSTALHAQTPPHGMQLVLGDDCTNPFVIAGLGTFNYDCQLATTGVEGQNEAICISSGITTDMWYRWTAPSSGNATMTLCGSGTLMDSKIAAYSGSTCPVDGTALACNDDSCFSSESRILFPVVSGQSYMLQVGSFPGAGFGWYGVFTLSIAPSAVNDECASAQPIAGTGTFAFDNSAASTSTQQGLFCGFGYANQDVWFDWTASATGTCEWSLCGGVGFDSLIAAYAGAGCPAPGTALGCNDDRCSGALASRLSFPCVAGQHYLLQLGAYAVGAGSGTFSLDVVPPPANDDCSAPQALAGTGTFAFTLVGTSTGAQGQSEAACDHQGQLGIENDVWFSWTAPSSARARLSLCTGAAFDTKVAAYNGSGCPAAGTAITCNDEACGSASEICFDVTAGQAYLIQLGTRPGVAPGAGTFDLTLQTVLPPCTYDDGTSEGLVGLGGGGEIVWLQRFGSAGTSSLVDSIAVAWGSPVFPGSSPGNGTPTDVFLWQDGPTQDGDPSDAILLHSSVTSVASVDSDTFVAIPFAPVAVQGIFFVGTHLPSAFGQPVVPMDQNCPSARVAWFFGAGPGQTVDYANPGSNPIAPLRFDDSGVPANLLLRAGCTLDPAQYVCAPGSGGVLACPCANPPAGPGRGCDNKDATGGASISASGSNQISNPTLVLSTAGQNATVGSVLIQGTSLNSGVAFGHGVRCTAGTIKRLYVKLAVGGSITAPQFPTDADIPARSAALGNPILVGEQRIYQVYYRDTTLLLPGCPLPANQFNVTNAALVSWLP